MQVACLHVPNFLVALAQRDDPSLCGRPIIIGGSPGEHASVAACSEEAASAGVAVGTTLRRALALCPTAVFLPLTEGLVTDEATRLEELLALYSPAIEAIAPGHLHVDVRGLARMARMEEAAWLADLHEMACATSRLQVRLAAARTVFAAHAATIAHQPAPILVPDGETLTFLGRLPVEALPVPPLMHQRLRLFGLERVGQVADLPFSAMQAQFGRDGARAWQLARGRDDATITPRKTDLRITEETDLPAPASLSEPLVVGTRHLLQRALNRKEVRGQSVRRLDWHAGLESGEQVSRRFVFREPTDDAGHMLFVARQRIERLALPAAATSLGVTLSGFCSEYGHQSNLWTLGPRRWKELTDAVEQLHARTESPQVYRIVEVQPWSRIPERQLGLVAFGP